MVDHRASGTLGPVGSEITCTRPFHLPPGLTAPAQGTVEPDHCHDPAKFDAMHASLASTRTAARTTISRTPCSRLQLRTGRLVQPTRVADVSAEAAVEVPQQAITLSDKAVAHIAKLKAEMGKDNLLLRVGVKQGGCSGMSYVMDSEEEANLKEDDYVIQHPGFKMACDPKSLLFLFGMNLDYSDALIGGGFSFSNPNAESSCGCGKSFSV